MPKALIIGSGVAAAGAALALSARSDLEITVVDLGVELEPRRRLIVDRLDQLDPQSWSPDDLRLISEQPVASDVRGLPEKRVFGSDFPFRNVGQLDGLRTIDGVNNSLISAAYGGFSNAWGSQLMPFNAATFDNWPVSFTEMEPHYRSVLDHVPLAAEDDDLAEQFPLINASAELPPASQRTNVVLRRYFENRDQINRFGVTLGKARLAFRASECISCGQCMTGCPRGLIYSAAQTFDSLRSKRRIAYLAGLKATAISEDDSGVSVNAMDLRTGETHTFQADRAYIACGAIASTQLMMNSLKLFGMTAHLSESVQFTLPMISISPTRDPRDEPQFTLNQFNMVVRSDGDPRNVSQLHFYTYNQAFIDAMPKAVRAPWCAPVLSHLLRRTSVALGYLPSWASPGLQALLRSTIDGPVLEIRRDQPSWSQNAMLRKVLARIVRSGRLLDLYPVLPRLEFAAGGKSYHWGSSFPHLQHGATEFRTDLLGRVPRWHRTHVVDASVFPDIPATTFGLTVMANAHRIAYATKSMY